ncbi:hypothetical protein F5148DRAFT_1186323 [Russula earlei]|uniref:Uncharacterized protein n=1 Tax=Russula earlei TaxID=71964 RepID=A0ACC0UDD0_9AGAM|nr:hypothetical protein F5148DRAFT_1186323 [Russula earlei]
MSAYVKDDGDCLSEFLLMVIMANVEIFLCCSKMEAFSILSIPHSDIERLSLFPFPWIRYVMYAICGARGDLFKTPDGPKVDYHKTAIPDGEHGYYYKPLGDCAFVDFQGLNDIVTVTARTQRSSDFRKKIIERDGPACVVTEADEGHCDAVHLIPRSKGDEYIARVRELRSPEDEDELSSIDDITNGILLRKDLHMALGKGDVALIKTPNYGLDPEHIDRFKRGFSGPVITLQRLKEPKDYDPITLEAYHQIGPVRPGVAFDHGANVDAHFQGKEALPPTFILDYVYGVAAYKSWRSVSGGVPKIMKQYHEKNYAHISPPKREDGNPGASSICANESDLAKAMDELNTVLMYIHGISPEEAADRREREIEQEERAAQEAGRKKVMEWRDHLGIF